MSQAGQGAAQGGPGVTYSDLLVVNKTDLAPMVGADLGVCAATPRPRAATVHGADLADDDPPAAPVQSWVRDQLRVAQAV